MISPSAGSDHGRIAPGSFWSQATKAAAALAGRTPPLVRDLVRRLPPSPPSFVAARALDRLLWPRLPADARRALAGRAVHVELTDVGIRLQLRLGPDGFGVAPDTDRPVLTVRAGSAALWRLASGADDADRLFFERALVIEGDTEYGLILKNTLDAIGPLWA